MEREYKVACRGCHGGCVHIMTVRDGKAVAVRPDPDSPLSQGHACVKGMSILEQMYHPDRLLYPLRRKGPRGSGQFERISWDEALDEIAAALTHLRDTYGPASIATITGTGRHLIPYLLRFAHALGTPNAASAGGFICLGPRKHAGAVTSGTYACVDYYGPVQPACIVVWGADPTVSGADGELQWHPRRCARQGTKFIVIDPRKTALAEKAGLWLRLRPGTDGALALGILNVIISEGLYDHEFVEKWTYGFDELKKRCAEYNLERVSAITWVPAEQIAAAARMMATVKPMSLEWGCAFEQGHNASQTCRAIYMIPAITGNYDVPGGFVESKHIMAEGSGGGAVPDPLLLNHFPTPELKHFAHPLEMLEAARTGKPYKVRALLAFANNCLASLPDSRRVHECLEALDFFVSMDIFMTPTAAMSDIVLPAALWPELDCIFGMPEFAEHTLLVQQKAVQVGEARPDEDVFVALCKRMGLDYGASSHKELIEQELAEIASRFPELEGVTFDELKERGWFTPERRYEVYKTRGGFPTPTGKFELWSTKMAAAGGDPLPFWTEPPMTPVSRPDLAEEYPYVLTTGSRSMPYFISNNRQVRSLRRLYPFPLVRMHPDTAAAHGIAEGDWVFIRTDKGRITQKAKLEPDMDRRVINCDFGWWYPEAPGPGYGWDESNANVLTGPEHGCDPYMGSYQLRASLCAIERNPDRSIEERYYASPLA